MITQAKLCNKRLFYIPLNIFWYIPVIPVLLFFSYVLEILRWNARKSYKNSYNLALEVEK